jgi:uncharacterized protein YbjT (DUF2867 family)
MKSMLLAVSGASGKTGWRVVQEALAQGHQVRALLRPGSAVPPGLEGAELVRLELGDGPTLEKALDGCQALVIATGARPGIDLTTPLRVDAWAVGNQIRACEAVGVNRVLLVSSLCAGRWCHALNLFGLILVVKRLGERALERSSLDWTIIRPGGLGESESDLEQENVHYSQPDHQQDGRIPRRLVAQVCLEALATPLSQKRIIEITSTPAIESSPGSTDPNTDKAETDQLERVAALSSASSTRGLASWLTLNP